MQDWIHERTRDAGYERYEVSAYAKPHRQSRHNLNYWRFGDYLGIGAGAHTKLSFPSQMLRQARFKHPATYIEQALAGTAVQEEHEVGPRDLPFEFMLNALRLVEGFPVHRFVERTGLVDDLDRAGACRGRTAQADHARPSNALRRRRSARLSQRSAGAVSERSAN